MYCCVRKTFSKKYSKYYSLAYYFYCLYRFEENQEIRLKITLTIACFFLPSFYQYVIVSSKKILFYDSEQDKEQSNPYMVLDIE